MKGFRCLLCCVGMLFTVAVSANVSVGAQIDSTVLMIGDQSGLTLLVNQPMDVHVSFPLYVDTLPGGLEVVGLPAIDTVTDQERWQVRHRYQVTAFEDSLYLLSALPFVCEGDTLWSEPVALNVIQPFEVDTASHVLADIKEVYRAPIYWWGIMRIVLGVLLGVALLVLAWWLYCRYGKKSEVAAVQEQEELRDPWEVAMEGLQRIKDEKTWQQAGRQKVYYTDLTDVVRTYAEAQYGVNCMEMPTSETLRVLRHYLKEEPEAYAALKGVLELADLVKFAKWTALPDECEGSLRQAYVFLERTHKEEEAASEAPNVSKSEL